MQPQCFTKTLFNCRRTGQRHQLQYLSLLPASFNVTKSTNCPISRCNERRLLRATSNFTSWCKPPIEGSLLIMLLLTSRSTNVVISPRFEGNSVICRRHIKHVLYSVEHCFCFSNGGKCKIDNKQ